MRARHATGRTTLKGPAISRTLSDYGMVLVLVILCAAFSAATWDEQSPRGAAAGEQVAGFVRARVAPPGPIVIVAKRTPEDSDFAGSIAESLRGAGYRIAATVQGDPSELRSALSALVEADDVPAAIACGESPPRGLLSRLDSISPRFADVPVIAPRTYRWPNFLKSDNLLNIANQIAVIAIIAAGMTLVIVTGGIDLSVGSLVAFSSVVAAVLIRDYGGAENASIASMIGCCAASIGACALVGMSTGVLVTLFRNPPRIPPFIVTLSVMLMASGAAYMIAEGQSVNQVPPSFVWLGRGADLGRVPNAVVLMIAIYAAVHVLMTRTSIGRYIYAVGGNAEAARMSGVPVRNVLVLVYSVCGGLAGLGGVVLASQLRSGAPTYGIMYELYVIAAVVVGGTSLSGGEGRVLGTLVGAFIIAVIQNGMNLIGLESYTQKIVLGGIILLAVLLDMMKKRLR